MNGLYTALIAGGVSIIGTLVTYISVKGNLKAKINELKLKESEIIIKQKEFENTAKNIELHLETLKQNQLSEIVKKRINVYPKLWKIIISYGTEWVFEEKKYDIEWAKNYRNELREYNKEYGVFFSQEVYNSFFYLRQGLTKIIKKHTLNNTISQSECAKLYELIINITTMCEPLSVVMKDDLGSYSKSIIQESE